MRWALSTGLGAVIAMLGLSSCAPSQDYQGPEIGPAIEQVVSLNPCTDAILVEIAPNEILALSHYSHDPRSSSITQDIAQRYAVTGGTVEEVLALGPDRVFSSKFMPPAAQKALRNLGIPVDTFGSPTSVKDNKAQIRRLARQVGHSDRGRALEARIEEAIRWQSEPDNVQPITTVLWQSGEIVPGETTLIAELMEHAGFTSHSAAIGLGQADRLSLEQLLANPPELLLIAGESTGQKHRLLDKLEETRVEYFDPKLLYCGGPTIIAVMERLGEIREGMR